MIADNPDMQRAIVQGRTALGIEFGSTRIKAVLIGEDHAPLAVGSHSWENQFVGRLWTYSLGIGVGRPAGLLRLPSGRRAAAVRGGVDRGRWPRGVGDDARLPRLRRRPESCSAPFRTWRNTNTGAAVERLSALFGHNIPHRWSIAHLYQVILDNEDHVGKIAHLTTLAGYVHWKLTGEQVLGVGDASGMFPIDVATGG